MKAKVTLNNPNNGFDATIVSLKHSQHLGLAFPNQHIGLKL